MCVCGGVVEIGILALVFTGAVDIVRRVFGLPPLARRSWRPQLGRLADTPCAQALPSGKLEVASEEDGAVSTYISPATLRALAYQPATIPGATPARDLSAPHVGP